MSWGRHILKLILTLWGKVRLIYETIRLSATADHCTCLAEGLADDHFDRSLAVPRDCPRKIKFVRAGEVENVKSTLCELCRIEIENSQLLNVRY